MENEGKLADLTRYYSVSFKSEIEDSHIWMQMTKRLAQFSQENDGVVALRDSRFPKSFFPVDLGVIEADHLGGNCGQ